LEALETRDISATAYADDLVLIVGENSRSRVEESACVAIDTLLDWCTTYKLQIATEKTKAMLVKGNLHNERVPRIFILGKKIDFVVEHRYLGIYIDKKLSFIPHVQHLRDKINSLSGLLKRTIHDEWGLKRKAYQMLYKCLYVPVITYGAVAWYHRVSHSHVERVLNSIQRKLLLYITRACRTTSTAAMQVISGCKPIKLEIIQKALLAKVRRLEPVTWNTYHFVPDEDRSEKYLKEEKEKLETTLYNH